jgi:hypothetical protein
MCLGGHLVRHTFFVHIRFRNRRMTNAGIPGKITVIPYPRYSFFKFKTQAAFDPRVLSSVCFFATDIHSASLGKGKNDDTLVKVRNGDLTGKGELVVCAYIFQS